MSVLNVNKIADASGGVLAPISSVMRNRIINGAMVIDQRNAGASSSAGVGYCTVDRWNFDVSASGKVSAQQNAGSVTPPAGFTNYLGITSLSAFSVSSSDYIALQQIVEGFNAADLGWGTANASTVTLSFWIRSSLTGTFGGAFVNSAGNRSYPFTYTISAANTWEQKSITVAGDTTGTWLTDNGRGIRVYFSLGAGSTYSGTAGAWAGSYFFSATGATSVVGTNGATWYVTGVQLEKGAQATGFEYRQYGQELALCQRYCQWLPFNMAGYQAAGASIVQAVPYKVTMRTVPAFAAITADPNCSTLFGNQSANSFNATYSGVDGATALITATAAGTTYAYGFRSLATAEL